MNSEAVRRLIAKPEAAALSALSRGQADAAQQVLAFACIRQKLCGEADASFDPANSRITDFNEGRRSVGIALRFISASDPKDF